MSIQQVQSEETLHKISDNIRHVLTGRTVIEHGKLLATNSECPRKRSQKYTNKEGSDC